MSVVSGHSQNDSVGWLPGAKVRVCDTWASPNGSEKPENVPSAAALVPECGLVPSKATGGTLESTLQLAAPFSKPPLVISSCGSEHDAVRKWKHAELADGPHALPADTVH